MASMNLGRVVPIGKGEWNSASAYNKLDFVAYQGNSYIARQDVPAGTVLSNTNYWQIMAQKGSVTETGVVAEHFEQNVNYYAGDYVIYDGNMFRFTQNHPAGAWNASHTTQVNIGDELESRHYAYFVRGTQTTTTGNWTGNLPEVPALYDGLAIDYYLPYGGSGNATLNLTLKGGVSTGAVNCYFGGNTRLTTHIGQYYICRLIYMTNVNINGTNYTGWWLLKAYDSTNTYDFRHGGDYQYKADSAIYRYQLLFHKDEYYLTPLNNVNNSVGTSKTMLTNVTFDPFDEIYYYNSTADKTAGQYLANACFYAFGAIDLRFTFNCGSTLTQGLNVYMKILMQADKTAKIADSMPLVQTLPTTNDGVYYMLLGRATGTYTMCLYPTHPIYYHNGTEVVELKDYYTKEESDALLGSKHYAYFVAGTQTGSTGSWTGNLPEVNALYDGLAIDYWLPYAGSGNATLNLTLGDGSTTTGAINVYNNGTTRLSTQVNGSNLLRFVYRSSVNISGTNYTGWWRVYDSSPNTSSNLQTGGTAFKAHSVTYRYQLMVQVDEDHLMPLTNADNNAGTSKTMITNVDFDAFGQIFFYGYSSTVNAEGTFLGGTLYFMYGLLDPRYSLNTGSTLTPNKPFYLKVVPQSNGKVRLATGTCWAQDLPTTNDGFWYIQIGRVVANNYQIGLYPHHPVYYHDGTGVKLVMNPKTKLSIDPEDITNGYLEKRIYINTHPENVGTLIPFINNDLAFISKKGGSVDKYFTTSTDYTQATLTRTEISMNTDALFDGCGNYTNVPIVTENDVLVIDVTIPEKISYGTTIYIDFGANNWRAKTVTMLVRNNETETTFVQRGAIQNNTRGHIMFGTFTHTSTSGGATVQGFNQLRMVLSNWNNNATSGRRIAQIGMVRYNSYGIRNISMSRGIDDDVYRNIHPFATNTYSLGTSDKKWANIYAENMYLGAINGVTVPSSPKFTDTTYTNGNGISLSGTTFSANFPSSGTPAALGTASNGSANTVARSDHVHAKPSKSDIGLGNVTNDTQIKASVGTTAGDIIYFTGSATPTRLGIGSNGQVLKVVSGVPAWSSDSNSDTNVTNTLATTTKYYVTGTTSASTNTGTQSFDSGIYATTTAGQLNATTYKVNEQVTLQWNATDKSLDFVFAS